MTARPDTEKTLKRLKDFQRRSVDHVFHRLYTDADQVDRFLLADEVGLGKTMVARGVIARAVEHLWDSVERIDVIYICSNGDIARQNINRLKLEGQEGFSFASRLTLLPVHTQDLSTHKLNFISFTPGTSFDMGSSSGIMQERALLFHLLEEPWELRGAAPKNVLQCWAGANGWKDCLDDFHKKQRHLINRKLASSFVSELEKAPMLKERFSDLCGRFQQVRSSIPNEDSRLRDGFIGELRRMLARCCIQDLQPDLVILDEFQRFRNLLHGEDEVAALARELFTYHGHQGDRARVLLLSATPYKMYTLSHETDDDHYRDFLETARFLFNSHDSLADFERELRTYRAALCLGGHGEGLAESRAAIERRLRKVMCRTERLAVSTDRNGMLHEVRMPADTFSPADAAAFSWIDRTAATVGSSDCIELWKSGSYLLNFMEDYELKRKVRKSLAECDAGLHEALREPAAALFPTEAVRNFEPVDSGNARLRSLLAESIDCGGWKLLWMPPSLPYYAPGGVYADPALDGFTKALVFSSWQLVPKVIAVLGSYEAERRMVRTFDESTPYSNLRTHRRPLLRFALVDDRLTGMALLTLLYPCITLAQRVDPLAIGRDLATNGEAPSSEAVLAVAESRIREFLAPMIENASTDGPPDEKWYWASLLLLDRAHHPEAAKWLKAGGDYAWHWMAGKGEDDSNFAQHVDEARRFIERPEVLGPPPANLVHVLARAALASPAIAALRSLGRRWPGIPSVRLMAAAARVAMGFRTMFNRPETILFLRGMNPAEPYWERVLDYGIDGNLQAVIDEYAHVLIESLGLESAGDEAAKELSQRIHDAVSMRTITLGHDEFVEKADGGLSPRQMRMRCRYALRFGDGESGEGDGATREDDGKVTREDQVRNAFNSPFRPFILASTSVGQEGLDFHLYCRAVYHWNLPSNPVDLEQREGRVHRYKGHVIRKNLAARYGLSATAGAVEPWDAIFAAAVADRPAGQGDLIPFWVFEGPWRIERRVPLFPLSRETVRLDDLKRSLALYRLVFGQPRQEELLRLLRRQTGAEETPEHLAGYRIDLSPGMPQ